MKTLMLPSVLIVLLLGVIPPAQAGQRKTDESSYYPRLTTYESNGTQELVRKVQRALEEDGYYVGDTSGQFGYETRAAVRRYRRDHGLPIVGKIDDLFLRTLGFQKRDI